MNRVISMDLLAPVDEAAELRIAEEFPIDWGKDALFEKIYQRYAGDGTETAVTQHRNRAQIYRIAGLAACLLLTVGAGLGIWARQQKLPVQPPEPLPVTEPETQQATEPAATLQETGAAETAPAVLPAATEAATEQAAETLPTEPQETAAPTEQTSAPDVSDTEAPPAETQVPVTEAPTEAPTEPAPEEEQLDGFKVLHFAEFRQIICTDAFPEPDGTLQDYTVDGDAVELLETSDSGHAERSYQVAKGDRTYTVTQQEYAEFVMQVDEGELIDISVNRAHGFFHLREETCTLYWFRDGEGFCISGDAADLTNLLEIARSFTPADTSN